MAAGGRVPRAGGELNVGGITSYSPAVEINNCLPWLAVHGANLPVRENDTSPWGVTGKEEEMVAVKAPKRADMHPDAGLRSRARMSDGF